MFIKELQQKQAIEVAQLLNDFLPFEEESEKTINEAGGIQLVAIENEEIIGYIAGVHVEKFEQAFPYDFPQLQTVAEDFEGGKTFYTSHLVVHPKMRGKGIGTKLVKQYMEKVQHEAERLVVVGWVKSDTKMWDAEKQFKAHQFEREIFIPQYFEPYNVYCPNCNGKCICDATILYKKFD